MSSPHRQIGLPTVYNTQSTPHLHWPSLVVGAVMALAVAAAAVWVLHRPAADVPLAEQPAFVVGVEQGQADMAPLVAQAFQHGFARGFGACVREGEVQP